MLSKLTLSHLRNITGLTIQPSAGINLLLGENGSGKTSILEAIHMLALGRSFRTRNLKNAVQFGQQHLQVFAKTTTDIPVGLQYHHTEGLQIRLNTAPLKKLSELATQLPLQYISANCHQFFELGPRYRRQLIDWGLFHVEPEFNYHWQSYRKILQQRNAAIRQKKALVEIQMWDKHLGQHGESVHLMRENQLNTLLSEFINLFPRLCPEFTGAEFTLKYSCGWQKELQLSDALKANVERDKKLGYTRSGTHAADWSFKINEASPIEMLSRGQQKLFFLALSMAQIIVTKKKSRTSMLLLDDISSELDSTHQQYVLEELTKLSVQCFVTSTDNSLIKQSRHQINTSVFHVKHGCIYSE